MVVLNFGRDQADDVMLFVAQSGLPAGAYVPQSLLGDASPAELTIGDNGAIENYAPLPSLAPKTGYIFKLTR